MAVKRASPIPSRGSSGARYSKARRSGRPPASSQKRAIEIYEGSDDESIFKSPLIQISIGLGALYGLYRLFGPKPKMTP